MRSHQTLCYNYVAIVVLEVILLLRPLYILYFANTVQHKVDKLKQSKKARTIRTIYRVKTIK